MKNLKTKLGIFFIILAIIAPLFSFLVPYLGLSKAWSATIIGFLVAGLPEIFFIIGGILAGKELVEQIKDKGKEIFKNKFYLSLFILFLILLVVVFVLI